MSQSQDTVEWSGVFSRDNAVKFQDIQLFGNEWVEEAIVQTGISDIKVNLSKQSELFDIARKLFLNLSIAWQMRRCVKGLEVKITGNYYLKKIKDHLVQSGYIGVDSGRKKRRPTMLLVNERLGALLKMVDRPVLELRKRMPSGVRNKIIACLKDETDSKSSDVIRRWNTDVVHLISSEMSHIGVTRLVRPYMLMPDCSLLPQRLVAKRDGNCIPYMYIKQSLLMSRDRLLIDGEKVCEPDWSSLHPHMLYRMNDIDLEGDAYDIDLDVDRVEVKKAFSTMVNAKRMNEKYESPLFDAILKKHDPISDLFFKDLGIQLMAQDSDIIINCLGRLLDLGIPGLPMHDSMVCRKRDVDTVASVMDEEFVKYMGWSCPISL